MKQIKSNTVLLSLISATVILLTAIAALNGGTALTASAFDGIVTTIKGMLSSTMVLSFAMIALFAAVWQITHGNGYGALGLVLGVLAVAIIGPTFMTTVSTTIRHPNVVMQHANQAVIAYGSAFQQL